MDLYQQGNEHYDQGEFDKAIESYQSIIQAGLNNSKVYYNLGNAYFRNGELGNAILSYRRAERLDPRDEDIKANIEYVKLYTLDKIQQENIHIFSTILKSILNWATLDEWTIFVSGIYFLGMLLGIVLVFLDRLLRPLLIVIVITLILFILSGSLLYAKIRTEALIDRGVVITAETDVRSGPGEDYTLQFTAHEGLEFEIKDQKDSWYLIVLPNGVMGWLEKQTIAKI
ncbi:MAG: tetratricopeptide repeat protein [Candidatus Zixiibacteriota bacterium]